MCSLFSVGKVAFGGLSGVVSYDKAIFRKRDAIWIGFIRDNTVHITGDQLTKIIFSISYENEEEIFRHLECLYDNTLTFTEDVEYTISEKEQVIEQCKKHLGYFLNTLSFKEQDE